MFPSDPGAGSGRKPSDGPNEGSENRGTIILDAVCASRNISYPQDVNLLNVARENLESLTNYRNLKLEIIRKRAEEEGAEFIVVYMLRPNRDSIEFDDLGELIMEYFMDNFPGDLDELSSHTKLSEVCVEAITDISLTERDITIKGEASVTVLLQYGSDREQEEDEEEESMTLPMDFEVFMNWNREITDMDYEIDTSDI